MKKMPVLFIGHGSPMNAIQSNPLSKALNHLGESLPQPQAILVVSAHWETHGSQVLSQLTPPTIHDFYGFPKPLFEVQYPAPGPLKLAEVTQKLIPGSTLNKDWGLDHGTWSVLVHMYPQANIPVYQLSLDTAKTPEQHLQTGKYLRDLREQGVLILGSGNIVHNLGVLNWQTPTMGYDWAQNFDLEIKTALENRDEKSLSQFSNLGDLAKMAVPTPEHYLPLLYAVGASDDSDSISYPYEGYEYGSLSMRAVQFS